MYSDAVICNSLERVDYFVIREESQVNDRALAIACTMHTKGPPYKILAPPTLGALPRKRSGFLLAFNEKKK